MTQEEYLEALRSGAKMNFNDLIKLINENYNYTPASFINGDLQNTATENQGSAKLFCFGVIHQLTKLEVLHCFGEHYQGVLNDPQGDSHQNIRNFIIYGWEGLKFDSPVLVETSNPKYPLQADSKQNFGTTLIRSINQLYDFMGYYVKKNFIIRDLCINMNTHQNTIFHQLDNFIKHSHSFAMTIFRKITHSAKLGVLMSIHIYAKVFIIITIVSGGRYVLFQSETVNNTTNITNNTTNIINNTTNTTNNPPIAFIATAAPIVAQVVIDIESLFEVIDIESLFEVIDIESLFEVIDIEPFKQKQQEIDDLNLTLSTAATNIAEQAIHPTVNQIFEEIENDLAAIVPEEVK
ncbi:Type III effector HopPmaJ [uncultured Gammaproteobacteria bacterium]|nr:Type III effector HopPmaJ [uncultured Gammaproteobacteria bacterium]